MIRFFKRADWRQHARPRAEGKALGVGAASRIAELARMAEDGPSRTPEDIAAAERDRQRYLNDVARGK